MTDAERRTAGPAALHAVVRGRVQGVGFREFVRRTATALNLDGWVRNLPDGRSVELYADGDRAALERLVERLHEGPRFASVDDVAVTWQAAEQGQLGFQIRH